MALGEFCIAVVQYSPTLASAMSPPRERKEEEEAIFDEVVPPHKFYLSLSLSLSAGWAGMGRGPQNLS